MQDLKSEEQGSNGTALFLVALFIAIGGVGGYFLAGRNAVDAVTAQGTCFNVCMRNTGLIVNELNKKNYLKPDNYRSLMEMFKQNCDGECKGQKPSEE